MEFNDTSRGNRLHIGLFGKVNSGKSSLINALTGQDTAIVSAIKGTTTDPVYKAMEIYGIGPVVFIDTAGFSDSGTLGKKRVAKTREAAEKCDVALVLLASDKEADIQEAIHWVNFFKANKTHVLVIINKIDVLKEVNKINKRILHDCSLEPINVSALSSKGIDCIKDELIRNLPEDYEVNSITQGLCDDGDLVLLVMPQDMQAPKGRLILPQVQTIRDLLDKKCIVMSCTTDRLKESLCALKKAPDLIVCDSQVFKLVYELKPQTSKLTSFSVLFAHYKGDINAFISGASAIDKLNENSRILIAEACTHAPLSEDIGRVKIPALLRKKVGESLHVDIVGGADFPTDISNYDLIIHCGACMFNRKYVLNRIEKAKKAGVAITNYGICIAYLNQILDKIDLQ